MNQTVPQMVLITFGSVASYWISHRIDKKDFRIFLTDINGGNYFALRILFLSHENNMSEVGEIKTNLL